MFKEVENTETTLKVKNQNKFDRKIETISLIVEEVNDMPVVEKQINDNLEEKASLDDIYAVKANDNEENELLDEHY